jgi:hypothetical protein
MLDGAETCYLQLNGSGLRGGAEVKSLLKRIWAGWKRVAHKIGRFQTRVLLTVFYYLVVGPTWAVLKMAGSDPLDRRPKAGDYFKECRTEAAEGSEIERARHQF